jgi:hypothetical protein
MVSSVDHQAKQQGRGGQLVFTLFLITFQDVMKQQLILGTGTAIWWVTEPHCFFQS